MSIYIYNNVNFDNRQQGTYTKAMAQADFPGAGWYSPGLDSGWGQIVPGREGRGNSLRVTYSAGKIGSASAIQIKARFLRRQGRGYRVGELLGEV